MGKGNEALGLKSQGLATLNGGNPSTQSVAWTFLVAVVVTIEEDGWFEARFGCLSVAFVRDVRLQDGGGGGDGGSDTKKMVSRRRRIKSGCHKPLPSLINSVQGLRLETCFRLFRTRLEINLSLASRLKCLITSY